MNRLISPGKTNDLVRRLKENGVEFSIDQEKHRLIFKDPSENELFLRLPLNFTLTDFSQAPLHYVILLIQSGHCSLGYFENERNRDHKVFKSYMVRMKQGFSQVKYLKTKGKSRAGSRVRLGETAEFFENINSRLQEYFSNYHIDKIAISCPKILIPFLYGSKGSCPFDKNDPRLFKIPKHIHTPGYEILLNAQRYLLSGELIFQEEQSSFVGSLLG
jgi:hypothetical protein